MTSRVIQKPKALAGTWGECIAEFFGTMVLILFGDGCVATFALFNGFDLGTHTWVVIAADRFSTSGDSYIDFEFLQNTLTRTNNGLFVSTGPDGGRTKCCA